MWASSLGGRDPLGLLVEATRLTGGGFIIRNLLFSREFLVSRLFVEVWFEPRRERWESLQGDVLLHTNSMESYLIDKFPSCPTRAAAGNQWTRPTTPLRPHSQAGARCS
jgi:hypothetical protein